MLNFDRIVSVAAKAAGDRPVLAAPYSLPTIVCRELSAQGVISGRVAEICPNPANKDPDIAGWWINRCKGVWFLRRDVSRSIILLSIRSEDEIGGRLLLEARLKGYKRMLLVGPDGAIVREVDIASALLSRLPPISPTASYESAFEEMYALVGDRLRLLDRAFDPSRVLVFTSLGAGGAERQATYTALGLAKRWPGKVHVARLGEGDFYRPTLDSVGIPTYVVSGEDPDYSSSDIAHIRNELASRYFSLGFLNIFHMIFHQALLIRTLRPGLVHTFQDYTNILAGIAADLVGVPRLVLSGRSVAPDHFAIFQPYMAPGYHALLRRREVVFLNNSEAGANDYARWLDMPRDRFRVVHNGFEFPELEPKMGAMQRRTLGIPQSAVVVGSIIGFREEKRPQLFLEMARLLHADYPDARFVIFGDGPLLANCREFVETQGLSEFIQLPGLTNDAWRALSVMDVFVLTSRLEGLPNVLIEAQAMAVPVVCTGAGGMSETFVEGQTGFGVPSATAEALAAAVSRLIDDRALRDRMGAAAMRHARETFGIDRMIDLTIESYASASRRKSGVAD